MIGEAPCVSALAQVAFHGEEDVAPLGSPMQVVEVRIEGVVGWILARICFVSCLVEAQLELED